MLTGPAATELRNNLDAWLRIGENTNLLPGVGSIALASLMALYVSNGEDDYQNKILSFTGLPFQIAMLTIGLFAGDPQIPAGIMTGGMIQSFTGLQMEVLNHPGDTIISNNISTPGAFPLILEEALALITIDIQAMVNSFPEETAKEECIKELRERWAKFIEVSVKTVEWTLTYTINTVPQTVKGFLK